MRRKSSAGLVISLPDKIFLYTAMYTPIRPNVTGPLEFIPKNPNVHLVDIFRHRSIQFQSRTIFYLIHGLYLFVVEALNSSRLSGRWHMSCANIFRLCSKLPNFTNAISENWEIKVTSSFTMFEVILTFCCIKTLDGIYFIKNKRWSTLMLVTESFKTLKNNNMITTCALYLLSPYK